MDGMSPRRETARRIMGWVNRYFMVPAFRAGLGSLIGNPLAGYVMVLRTRGRKSGRPRYAPLNYAILAGDLYCLSGWGEHADWYRNLRADPAVEVLLPGGTVAGSAEPVNDPDEALRAGRAVLRNSGFAAYAAGIDPRRIGDEALRAQLAGTPVLRIRPTGLGAGPHDPGGWAWLVKLAALGLPIAWWWERRSRRR